MFSWKTSRYYMVGATNQNVLRILWSLLSFYFSFPSQKETFFVFGCTQGSFWLSDVT